MRIRKKTAKLAVPKSTVRQYWRKGFDFRFMLATLERKCRGAPSWRSVASVLQCRKAIQRSDALDRNVNLSDQKPIGAAIKTNVRDGFGGGGALYVKVTRVARN